MRVRRVDEEVQRSGLSDISMVQKRRKLGSGRGVLEPSIACSGDAEMATTHDAHVLVVSRQLLSERHGDISQSVVIEERTSSQFAKVWAQTLSTVAVK